MHQSIGLQNELKGTAVEQAANQGRRLFFFLAAARGSFAALDKLNRHATQAVAGWHKVKFFLETFYTPKNSQLLFFFAISHRCEI